MEIRPLVVRIQFFIRLGQSHERVTQNDTSVILAICKENRFREDAGTTTPYSGFDKIAGNLVADDGFHHGANIGQSLAAHHSESNRRPIPAVFTVFGVIIRFGVSKQNWWVFIDRAIQGTGNRGQILFPKFREHRL